MIEEPELRRAPAESVDADGAPMVEDPLALLIEEIRQERQAIERLLESRPGDRE